MARSHHTSRDDIRSFDSIEDYLAFLRGIPRKWDRGDNYFAGVQSFSSCLYDLEHGNDTYLAQAEAIIEKMNDLQLFSEGQTVIETDVVGFAPSVPEAIMGVPKSMFNRSVSDLPHMNAPLSIYFETTCPAHVSKTQLVNRGVAILAFALAMSKSRAVEVYALSLSAKGYDVAYGAAVKLPTAPLDLGRVTWITASEGYSRRLGFAVVHSLEKSTDGLSKAWNAAHNASRELSIRDRFQLKDSDVVITRETENLAQMITDPIGWVRGMILKNQ